MFFSILVPVYNVEKYIKICLDSLLAQDFRDFEIILIDDGSTDKSGEICDQYAAIDKRIKVIHKKNEGLLLARRTGISAAKGKYLMHCDSDDYIALNTLREIYNSIIEKNYDMVMFGYDVVNDAGEVIEKHSDVFENNAVFGKKDKEDIVYKLVSTSWLNNMVTKLCKRECVDVNSDYKQFSDIQMGEDLFQVIPLVEQSNSFLYMAKPYYKYRFNQNGMSKNYKISYLENHVKISNRLFHLCDSIGASDSTYAAFFDRYEHDIYKYLLRFLKQGISLSDYKDLYDEIKQDELLKKSKDYRSHMRQSNAVFRIMLQPSFYVISKFVAKTILSQKLS